ncbi:MAG: GH3 auxin-responsive promoter family protein [Odoribacter sp.]|nr:GH3 auxin-responsive promoter family protein [Odoribacter sp.]
MINITPLLRPRFVGRIRPAGGVACDGWCKNIQTRQLHKLLHKGSDTAFGREHGLHPDMSYEDFCQAIPVGSYPDFRSYVERMLSGEKSVLWPGLCNKYAQSSGTSDGKSKYIPITDDSLRLNHYAGGADVVSHYLDLYPDSRLFAGKSFILGGSFANEISDLRRGVQVGDLSANLIENINPAVNLLRVPSKEIALMSDWHEKLPKLARAALKENITNISGVPSWFLTVLREVIRIAGAETIHDVWPNLEVFFHGGISFAPYRSQYEAITDPARMHYLETYNASEGFFAVQDTLDPAAGMSLLLNRGIFFEFIPIDDIDNPSPRILAPWEVEPKQIYALVITSCNGLWRYSIGDTVRIENTSPLRISITGRTRSYINAFGEELMVHNAETALAATCAATGASVANYTAAPVFTTSRSKGRHQWLIEWTKQPDDIETFADMLDHNLQAGNSDYQAKRAGNIFLDRLTITTASPGLFDLWLEATGKLGGQRKVPRLSNSRSTIESMLNLNNQK